MKLNIAIIIVVVLALSAFDYVILESLYPLWRSFDLSVFKV